MGFTSFLTADTGRSISNMYSSKGALPVYMHRPGVRRVYEPAYEGYAVFAGLNVFEEMARINGVTRESALAVWPGRDDALLIAGVYLLSEGEDEVKDLAERLGIAKPLVFPQFTEGGKAKGLDYTRRPESCPDQGFFYENG